VSKVGYIVNAIEFRVILDPPLPINGGLAICVDVEYRSYDDGDPPNLSTEWYGQKLTSTGALDKRSRETSRLYGGDRGVEFQQLLEILREINDTRTDVMRVRVHLMQEIEKRAAKALEQE
jgi:hypothetical protein